MVRYKDRQGNLQYYVLVKDGEVIATFGNLKKLCNYVDDDNFPSYWTLIRKKENPIIYNDYRIFKVKHY